MDTLPITGNLTMLRVNGWQVWRDGDSVTLIDTGAPGSGNQILSAVPGIDRIVLTHGHVDHTGSAAELRESTGAPVQAGAGDAAVIRGEAEMAPPVLQDTERPILERLSASLPDTAPPVPVDRELVDADVLDFGGGAEILAIPGHTKGSIAIHLPRHGVLFTATPAPMSAPSCWATSTRSGHKPSRRCGGWPRSASRPPASATVSRSARVPVTASGRWPTSCHTDAVAAEPGIEPDTLDWTWVLTRACPECGLDPAVVHHACDVGHRVHHAYNVGHR
jgi:hypothetical protein